MPKLSVERTIGQAKKAVLGGLIGYNTEKMGKQKYKRFAVTLRERGKIVGGIVGEVWTTVLFIQVLDRAEISRQGFRHPADQGDRGRGKEVRGETVLCGYDELSGAGLLPHLRL